MRDVTAAATAAGSSVKRTRIDVGKDRPGTGHHDGERRIGRRQRRGDHLVAGRDARRAQRNGERVGAVADADRMARAGRRRELALERLELRAENEPSSIDHPRDGGIDRRPVRAGRQPEKRNHRVTSCCAASGTYSRKCSR